MDEEDFNLVSVVALLASKAIWIVAAGFIFTACFYLYSVKKPDLYRSSSVLVPTNSLELNSQENDLSLPGLLLQKSGGNIGVFQVMLSSYLVAEKVAKNLEADLRKNYQFLFSSFQSFPKNFSPSLPELVSALQNCLSTEPGDEGGLSLKVLVSTQSPDLSFQILSAYMAELESTLNEIHLKVTKNNEEHFKSQIKKNQKEFLEGAKELSQFDRTFDVQSGASVVNVDLARDDETVSLDHQNSAQIVGNIPSNVYLEYLLQKKMVLQKVNIALEQQFQTSRLELDRHRLLYHVIEPPTLSRGPFKPNRTLITLLGFFTGISMGAIGVCVYAYYNMIKSEFFLKLKRSNLSNP